MFNWLRKKLGIIGIEEKQEKDYQYLLAKCRNLEYSIVSQEKREMREASGAIQKAEEHLKSLLSQETLIDEIVKRINNKQVK